MTEILLRMKSELLSNIHNQPKEANPNIFPLASDIDSMIIIDRSVDLISPLCTQLTYEGLIDEVFGVSSSFVELDASMITPTQPIPANSSSLASLPSTLATPIPVSTKSNKTKKVPLNSGDKLYRQLRDLNFTGVSAMLGEVARRISADYEERHQAKTVSQIKEFIGKLGNLQQEHQSLRMRKTPNFFTFQRIPFRYKYHRTNIEIYIRPGV